jgi:hypothetical protein
VPSGGGPPLRPNKLHSADPSGDRIGGTRERDPEVRQRSDHDPARLPNKGALHSTISTQMEDQGQVVLQLPGRQGVQQSADAAQPHLGPHLSQHEGHLQQYQGRNPNSHPAPGEPAVETVGPMPGSRCSCISVLSPVQLPESSDFGPTPRLDYHAEGCLCVCHDEHSVLCALWLDVVLLECDLRDLHDDELRPQHNVEDVRAVERVGLWVVADWRPLGRHVQSPPPYYYGDEEHHGFQPGASRESSPDESYGWASTWCERQPDPVSAGRNYDPSPRRQEGPAQKRRTGQVILHMG